MAYETLAGAYDRLTQDVPYAKILAFYQQLMQLYAVKPETVLDLACGTGSLSVLLAKQGYRVLGVDSSEEMLTVAYEKAMQLEQNPPYFVHQSMQTLHLPAKTDCVICCLDAINYLVKPQDCEQAIRRVSQALKPGGLFLFDINSAEKLRGLDGQVFLDEDDEVYCVWRVEFDSESSICTYGMDIFRAEGELWRRSAELHREYAYTAEQLTAYLQQAGFTDIRQFADRALHAPRENEQRIYFAAIKE